MSTKEGTRDGERAGIDGTSSMRKEDLAAALQKHNDQETARAPS